MGLIENILIGVIHLLFVTLDIFFIVIIAKIMYDRWKFPWLKQAVITIDPLVALVQNYANELVTTITGKTYSEKTLLIVTVICLSIARLLVASLL